MSAQRASDRGVERGVERAPDRAPERAADRAPPDSITGLDVAIRADLQRLLRETPPPPLTAGLRAQGREIAARLASVRAAPLEPGERVGPYEVDVPLGEGGQATVYRARDTAIGRAVALKVPRPEVAMRLAREAEILFHLDHPHIVRIELARLDSDPPFIATELLGGGSLADLIRERDGRRIPLERVYAIADAVLDALDYAHARGVVHRDIKPANILFDEDGAVKVADFGIGKLSQAWDGLQPGTAGGGSAGGANPATAPATVATVVVGTPAYMAPEQENPSLSVDGRIDGRADLFALGKVLYEAMTGRSPRTIRPVSREREDVPPAWDDFIFRLVEDSPSERFPSAAWARGVLQALREGGAEEGAGTPAAFVADAPPAPHPAWLRERREAAASARIAAIREHPRRVLGDEGRSGPQRLVEAVIDHALSEAAAFRCHAIDVELRPDGACVVEDDGAGLPLGLHPGSDRRTVEVVLGEPPPLPLGRGSEQLSLAFVNALSEWLEVEVYQPGTVWAQRYERGRPRGRLEPRPGRDRRGTRLCFRPDPGVFGGAGFDFDALIGLVRQLAPVHRSVAFRVVDARTGPPRVLALNAPNLRQKGRTGEMTTPLARRRALGRSSTQGLLAFLTAFGGQLGVAVLAGANPASRWTLLAALLGLLAGAAAFAAGRSRVPALGADRAPGAP